MKKLLQVHFAFPGPFGAEMAEQLQGLAASINEEPGMIWKIWTENAAAQEAGGIYLFEDEASAEAYLTMHTARLQQLGVTQVHGKIFDVNAELTQINHGSIGE